MTKLRLLLREYEDVRYAKDTWTARFVFNTDTECLAFVKRLSEINAEYMLYTDKRLYKVEVFFNDENKGIK